MEDHVDARMDQSPNQRFREDAAEPGQMCVGDDADPGRHKPEGSAARESRNGALSDPVPGAV
jgi:hypothetical protein